MTRSRRNTPSLISKGSPLRRLPIVHSTLKRKPNGHDRQKARLFLVPLLVLNSRARNSGNSIERQCFNQPYLGCREFSAAFRLVDPRSEPATPIAETRDLGWMLYDLDYSNPADPKALFFRAEMKSGVIDTDRNTVEVRG